SAWRAPDRSAADGRAIRSVAAALFLLQPIARLAGRLRGGLTPWRRRGNLLLAFPRPQRRTVWSERWRSQAHRLLQVEGLLRARCMSVVRGGDTDRWDIQVRLGPLGSARLRVALEEHGQGCQLIRYHVWPRWSRALPIVMVLLAVWFAGSIGDDPYLAAVLGAGLLIVLLRACQEAGAAVALVLRAIGDDVEVLRAEGEAAELMDGLGIPHPAVTGWIDSRVPASMAEELHDRGR